MVTAKATKAADKSLVCRKFVSSLQKLYGKAVPKIEMSVVETMLFAACLEDNPWSAAESGHKKLLTTYFDLNEVRVSSVTELQHTLEPLRESDWKGLRIRSILRFVFETTYSYDFEKLRRQTLEQALKTLKKVNDITPFIRDFILHEILGSHVICLDTSMLIAARWLGLVPAKSDINDASEFLKGGVKKSEVSEFCFLLRCLATDPRFIPRFADHPESELSMDDVQDRLQELQSPPKKKSPKPVPPPKVPEKAAAKPPVSPGKATAVKPAAAAPTTQKNANSSANRKQVVAASGKGGKPADKSPNPAAKSSSSAKPAARGTSGGKQADSKAAAKKPKR
jgi:endonuclease III